MSKADTEARSDAPQGLMAACGKDLLGSRSSLHDLSRVYKIQFSVLNDEQFL